ncbi:MAG: hypothetical protein ABWY06_20115 [Pseudomonas sp.]|uniref:hypothetical protein n=1 Tax=Pseudomonas sp. TaxID=306 RepID=UPI003391B2C7
MKPWIGAQIVLLLMWSQHAAADDACPKTAYSSNYQKNLPIVDADGLIKSITPLLAGGQISCQVGINHKNPSTNERLRIETGSYEGIKYSFYHSDGSGTIQGDKNSTLDTIKDLHLTNWSIKCVKDGMDDTHWCSLRKHNISIGIWKNGSHFISVGNDHFPSSDITLRIDKNQPVTAVAESGFTEKQADLLISQMKVGESALSRYQEWPYRANKDKKVELYGFSEAWKILNVIYSTAQQ